MSDEPKLRTLPPYKLEERVRDLEQTIAAQKDLIERLKRALTEAGVKGF